MSEPVYGISMFAHGGGHVFNVTSSLDRRVGAIGDKVLKFLMLRR